MSKRNQTDPVEDARTRAETARERLEGIRARIRAADAEEQEALRAIGVAMAAGDDPKALRETRSRLRDELDELHSLLPHVEQAARDADREHELAGHRRIAELIEGKIEHAMAQSETFEKKLDEFLNAWREFSETVDDITGIAAQQGLGVPRTLRDGQLAWWHLSWGLIGSAPKPVRGMVPRPSVPRNRIGGLHETQAKMLGGILDRLRYRAGMIEQEPEPVAEPQPEPEPVGV